MHMKVWGVTNKKELDLSDLSFTSVATIPSSFYLTSAALKHPHPLIEQFSKQKIYTSVCTTLNIPTSYSHPNYTVPLQPQ
jgi:hypothetical protein